VCTHVCDLYIGVNDSSTINLELGQLGVKASEAGLQRNQLANEIKGALSLRFVRMSLIEQVITGTLNHRVPGSSPPQTARFRYDAE